MLILFFKFSCYLTYISAAYMIYQEYPEINNERYEIIGLILLFTICFHVALKIVPTWSEVIGNKLADKLISNNKKKNKEEKNLIKKSTALSITLTLSFMGLLIIWSILIENRFIANESTYIFKFGNVFVIICTLICLYPTLHSNGFIRKIVEEENLKLPIVVIAILISAPLFSKIFYEHSLMLVFHNLSKQKEKSFISKVKNYSGGVCRYGITLEGYTFMNGQVCNIGRNNWNEFYKLKINKVEILASTSPFGFTVKKIYY